MKDLLKILTSLSDAVWSFDMVSKQFVYINQNMADLFGYSIEKLKKGPDSWYDCLHPDDYESVVAENKKLSANKNLDLEYRIIVDGKIKWISEKKVLLIENDNPQLATAILKDITETKTAHLKLSESEQTYRYLFTNNPNPLWIYDLEDLRFLAVNHAAEIKYGYTEDEFLSMTLADIRPSEDIEELIKSVKKTDETYRNTDKVWRHIKKNGELIYVNIAGHGITYHGKKAEMVMAHDITSEVENRKKITLAKRNLQVLINNLDRSIWSIDINYRIITVNNTFRKTVEPTIERKIVLGESVFMPELGPENKNRWRLYYSRALRGESFSFIEQIRQPDNTHFFAETTLTPIKNNDEIIGVACISNNIQELLETQKRIVGQNKKLLELISITSHEMRGPVASILGLTPLFNQENPSDPFNAEILGYIEDLAVQLDSVIHTIVEKTYSLQQETAPRHSFQQNQSENESL